MEATGRCSDGSGNSLTSSADLKKSIQKDTSRLKTLNRIEIQMALTSSDQAETFQFS